MGRRVGRKTVFGWCRDGEAGFRARWGGILGALFGAGGHRSRRIRVGAWDERENRGRRQPKPVRSMVRQTLNRRSVAGRQPMILSVVRRVPADDLAGHEDHLADEAPELHGDVLPAVGLQVHHHGERALEVPRQRRHHHVGPVAHQVMDRHPERAHPVLQLLDHVLLVAARVGQPDDFRRAQVPSGGDVEEVADLVHQAQLALHPGDVLAHHHHPVRPCGTSPAGTRTRPRPRG